MGPDARNDKPSGRDDVVDAATVRGGLEARLRFAPAHPNRRLPTISLDLLEITI
jgi:hypothetical protein